MYAYILDIELMHVRRKTDGNVHTIFISTSSSVPILHRPVAIELTTGIVNPVV